MEYLEVNGKSVEEAIQSALSQLGVSREEAKVIVLSEGKSGFLGMGIEEARVRVETMIPLENEADLVDKTKGILETLLNLMGVTGSVVLQHQAFEEKQAAHAPVSFDIEGDDLGILIGRRGQTLGALQYIIRLIMSRQTKARVPVTIDVEGYKQRRYGSLQALARQIAEQVKASGEPFALEPMPANERRIIHLTLSDHVDVITESTGEGEFRKVVVLSRKQ
ncbi:RNA-binding cell elongation regulator Jag/EloR [Chloroflexota bacterium]